MYTYLYTFLCCHCYLVWYLCKKSSIYTSNTYKWSLCQEKSYFVYRYMSYQYAIVLIHTHLSWINCCLVFWQVFLARNHLYPFENCSMSNSVIWNGKYWWVAGVINDFWWVACECLIVWRCTYVEGRSQFEAGNKPRNKVIQLTMPVSIKPRANHASEASYHRACGFVDCLPFYLSPVCFRFFLQLNCLRIFILKSHVLCTEINWNKSEIVVSNVSENHTTGTKVTCFDKCQLHIAFYISWITVYSCFM